MVKSGQIIKVDVTFENTGTESHSFPVGCTIRHVSTNKDYDLPFQTKSVNKGSKGTINFSWTIPSSAPTGSYSIIAAVWEKVSNNLGVNRLDDDVVSNAFSVS